MRRASIIARNSLITFLARAMEVAAFIVFLAVITRYLGVEDTGSFLFITAVSFFLETVVNFGLHTILIREVARNKHNAPKFFGSVLSLRLVFILIFFVLLAPVLFFVRPETRMAYAVIISFLTFVGILSIGNLFTSIFQAFEVMEYDMVSSFFQNTTIVLGILLVWFLDLGFLMVFGVQLAGALVKTGTCFYIIRKKFFKISLVWDSGSMRNLLRESYPLAISQILRQGTIRVDTILLAILKGHTAVALFAIPYRVIMRLRILSVSISRSLLPEFSRSADAPKEYLNKLYGQVFKIFLITVLPIALIITALSKKIVLIFFGPQFAEAGISLQILCCILVPISLDLVCSNILVSQKAQKVIGKNVAICFLANIILDLALIPPYGPIGAVIATVFSSFLLLFLQCYEVSRFVSFRFLFNISFRPCIIFFFCSLYVYALRNINIIFALATGLTLYIVLLFAFNVFTDEEKEFLRVIARKIR